MTDELQDPRESAESSTSQPEDASGFDASNIEFLNADANGGGVSGANASGTDTPGAILQRLRRLPIFETLTDEEFRGVAGLLHTQYVPPGLLLIEQGASNHRLYIMRRGRALKRVIGADDIERRAGVITAGEIFNEASFLGGVRNSETIEAIDDLTCWSISREEFQRYLEDHPQIAAQVIAEPADISAEIQRVTRTILKYSWQRANEHVILFRKKHVIVFINSLWPGLIGLVIIGALLLPPVAIVLKQAQGWVILAVVIGSLIWLILQWVDWQNDYYAITDQRVLHRERVLLIRDEQDEVPLSRIQDTKVERPSFFASLVDVGNVTIEASGSRSKVRFEDIGQPDEVNRILFEQLARTRVDSHATQRARIRLDLRRELGMAPPFPPLLSTSQATRKPRPDFNKRVRSFREQANMMRNTLMPRMRLVRGDTITYRKHWLRLLQTIALPALLMLVFVVMLVVINVSSRSLSDIILSFPIILGVLGLGIVLLSWLAYQYEDWRNDIYIVTPDRLIDIDKSPFGLRGTSRREAKLGAVQNVTAKTRGILDNAFNVGDVIIQTAGGDGQLVFEQVYNPRRVQRDIVDRMDAYEALQREKEATQRRKEMAEWLGIYNDLTKSHEQEKPK